MKKRVVDKARFVIGRVGEARSVVQENQATKSLLGSERVVRVRLARRRHPVPFVHDSTIDIRTRNVLPVANRTAGVGNDSVNIDRDTTYANPGRVWLLVRIGDEVHGSPG